MLSPAVTLRDFPVSTCIIVSTVLEPGKHYSQNMLNTTTKEYVSYLYPNIVTPSECFDQMCRVTAWYTTFWKNQIKYPNTTTENMCHPCHHTSIEGKERRIKKIEYREKLNSGKRMRNNSGQFLNMRPLGIPLYIGQNSIVWSEITLGGSELKSEVLSDEATSKYGDSRAM